MRGIPRVVVAACVALAAVVSIPLLTVGVAGASKASDQKIADAGMLEPGDLPATWIQQARDPSSDKTTDYAAKRIPACKKYVEFRKTAL
jgi:hypothetical protein